MLDIKDLACSTVLKQYKAASAKAKMIIGVAPNALAGANTAIAKLASKSNDNFLDMKKKLTAMKDPVSMIDGLTASLSGPDFNDIFAGCPFLANLLAPFSNLNIANSFNLNIGSFINANINMVINAITKILTMTKNAVAKVLGALDNAAFSALSAYEAFLNKMGVPKLFGLLNQIESCLINTCDVLSDPKDRILSKFSAATYYTDSGVQLKNMVGDKGFTSGPQINDVFVIYQTKSIPAIGAPAGSPINILASKVMYNNLSIL